LRLSSSPSSPALMDRISDGKDRALRCPACLSNELDEFLTIEGVPVEGNFLWTSRDDAVNCARADIRLGVCAACTMVYNVAFDPRDVPYAGTYENSLHFSPTFRVYAEELADRLVHTYGLRGKDVVAIGDGDGWFLGQVCARGGNRGVSFDPNQQPRERPDGVDIRFVRGYFSEAEAPERIDLVLLRHVLEHLERPRHLLEQLRSTLAERSGSVLYLEVPNSSPMFHDVRAWDLIYEHCSYFTTASLRHLVGATGLRILRLGSSYGDQFLGVDAEPGAVEAPFPEPQAARAFVATTQRFASKFATLTHGWSARLSAWLDEGDSVAVWGAGTKGITFLNLVPGAELIDHVIDINPRKTGHHIAGTGQRILGPEDLVDARPDVVLVMNPAYEREVRETLETHGVSADVVPV
jgi:hypothetical protein